MTQEKILTLSNISKTFGNGSARVTALSNISFDVRRGDFIAITGTSGSGKSTLLNLLGLLDQPSTGTLEVNGKDVASLSDSDRDRLRGRVLSFVFQASHITGDESAARNAALSLRILGWKRSDQQQIVEHELEQYGVLGVASTLGRDLSGGEKARVALARATAKQPQILLADEPTGALDAANSEQVFSHLERLNREGTTVILITHDEDLAARAPTRIHLSDGQIRSISTRESSASSAEPSHKVVATLPRGSRRNRILSEIYDSLNRILTQTGRTASLLVAFMLGISGLIGAIGLGESASAQISQRITAAGLDEVLVTYPDAPKQPFATTSEQLERLDGVLRVGAHAEVAYSSTGLTRLAPDGESSPKFGGRAEIADSSYLVAQGAKVSPATALENFGQEDLGHVALVGKKAAKELGLAPSPAPDMAIWLDGTRIPVVGIITDPGRDSVLAGSVLFSESVQNLVSTNGTEWLVRTEPGYPAAVAAAAPTSVSPGNPGAIRVSTVADLASLRTGVGSDLSLLLGVLAIFLLTLACVSAAGSMYLAVRTRAPEVALRRAMGASRWSIARMFLYEGAFVGVAGGIAGSALGLLIVLGGSWAQGWTAVLDPSILAWGVLSGIGTGLLSAAIPARAAARREPADAIRG
ncbi:ATP-binding cassette domain-containing protein [Mycetocola saprophilus]|uniref:ABC transporter ATP-binding protein/permease n=1 Tax=Mycetocola saprophilus TaxID=76636 RepID=UPI003BF4CD84